MSRIEEIEARVAAATDGPWYRGQWMRDGYLIGKRGGYVSKDGSYACNGDVSITNGFSPDDFLTAGVEADAEFIAHVRQDVPWLLVEVKRLTAALRQHGPHDGLCCSLDFTE